jgi:hypothetical protein
MRWRSNRTSKIFAERDLSVVLESNISALKDEVSSTPDEYIAEVDEEQFIRHLIERFNFEGVEIHADQGYATTREEHIPAEWFPGGFYVREGKSYPKQVITFHLPFSGSRDLLYCKPSTWMMWTEEVIITDSEIRFDLINLRDDPEEINREVKKKVDFIVKQLENVLKDVNQYNSSLKGKAKEYIEAKKQKMAKQKKVVEGLAFPIKSSPSPTKLIYSPPKKTSLPPSSPTIKSVPKNTKAETEQQNVGVDNSRSVFIGYGGPDQLFAEKLNGALNKKGIKTFLFSQHAKPGQKIHRLMRDGVNQHDKVVLVCSKNSLDRPGVVNELEETLQREAREGGESILIPITLDDYVFTDWAPNYPDIAQSVRDRVVADFRGTINNESKFKSAVERLLEGLMD